MKGCKGLLGNNICTLDFLETYYVLSQEAIGLNRLHLRNGTKNFLISSLFITCFKSITSVPVINCKFLVSAMYDFFS